MNAKLIFRGVARVLSFTLTAVFVVFLFAHLGEVRPKVWPLSWHSLSFLLLLLGLVGLLLAWRFEVGAASLSLIGIVGFYLNEFQLSGFQRWPGGWVFPLMLATPLLYFASAFLNRSRVETTTSC
jgi:hypothetical protein